MWVSACVYPFRSLLPPSLPPSRPPSFLPYLQPERADNDKRLVLRVERCGVRRGDEGRGCERRGDGRGREGRK